jgi:hypothetical protein
MISIACPGARARPVQTSPARSWPTMSNGSPDARSAARQAKPSRVERGNGGWSRSAITGAARTRPRLSRRGRDSAGLLFGLINAACSRTVLAASAYPGTIEGEANSTGGL